MSVIKKTNFRHLKDQVSQDQLLPDMANTQLNWLLQLYFNKSNYWYLFLSFLSFSDGSLVIQVDHIYRLWQNTRYDGHLVCRYWLWLGGSLWSHPTCWKSFLAKVGPVRVDSSWGEFRWGTTSIFFQAC